MPFKSPSARATALLAVLVAVGYWAFDYHRPLPPVPMATPIWIAHALGGIDGLRYTNSREAFLHNYEQGFRLFEIDLSLSSDGRVCAFHDTQGRQITPRSPVKNNTHEHPGDDASEHLSSLCLDELTALMQAYPDTHFILDIKEPAPQAGAVPMPRQQAFQAIYQRLNQHWKTPTGQPLWQQIIPQIYAEEDLAFLQSLQHFPCVIHTLYRQDHSDAEVLRLIAQYPEIRAVAVKQTRFSRSLTTALSNQRRHVLVHTLNDPGVISAFHLSGAAGVYTDFHPPRTTTPAVPISQRHPSGESADQSAISVLCGSRD